MCLQSVNDSNSGSYLTNQQTNTIARYNVVISITQLLEMVILFERNMLCQKIKPTKLIH